MAATTHENGTVLDSPTINANVVGVQLISGYPGDPNGVAGVPEGVAGVPEGVVAGTPGEFLPEGATLPANITALRALELLEDGVDEAWTEGQYVVIGTGNVHWTGEDWATGAAPGEG